MCKPDSIPRLSAVERDAVRRIVVATRASAVACLVDTAGESPVGWDLRDRYLALRSRYGQVAA
jgi:hypothetical protein